MNLQERLRQPTKRLLQSLGLFGVAFRIHESLTAFRLRRARPEAFRTPAADGLPIPPAKLMVLVGGDTNVPAFFKGGQAVVDMIRHMLAADGTDVAQLKSILDFGCGCGRVLRHWNPLAQSIALHGTDYNRRLIRWCRRNLPFARYSINRLEPPLDYADSSFGLVYAFSIFTHLPAPLQTTWMRELTRVLTPGGYLFVTVHGESFVHELDDAERARFDAGELVVRHAQMAGSNLCTAFHPQTYLRQVLAQGLEVIDYVPAGLGQDVVLLRKPLPQL